MKNLKTLPVHRFMIVKYGGSLGEQVNQIYLPSSLLEKVGLPLGKPITCKIGRVIREIQIGQVHSQSNTQEPILFLSPDLTEIFQPPLSAKLTLKHDSASNMLSIGPIIGLFTVKNVMPGSTFGSQEPTLLALANTAESLAGVVFVFSPEDINWENSTVMGYIPAPGNKPTQADNPAGEEIDEYSAWETAIFPLPDVVYDRLPSRTVESRPGVTEAKAGLLALPDSLYFNPMFLDKWETHLTLEKIPEVTCYLPPTRLVQTPEDIAEFLRVYKSVFLKPSSGSLGRRIIKIQMDDNGQYRYKYRSKDKQTLEGVVFDFDSLTNLLRRVMRKRTYIVQKDLHLAKFEDCPFDIRILAQKDKFGSWRRTKIYVRKAAPDNFLSNLSDGGRPKAITAVLNEVFNVDFQAPTGLGEDIRRAVRELPPALEKGTGLNWGELGIDLGVDRSGRIWLIEINSKPFRALVSESGSFKVIRRSLMRPLEFAKFLAGFYRHSPVMIMPPSQLQPEENTFRS